jgi:cell shape-determining protein MreD
VELVKADWVRVLVVLVVFGILQLVASWLGGLLIPSRFYFLHMLIGDLVSIAVLPIPIIGLVLLYQDIARTKLNVPEEKLAAQRTGLLTGPT